MIKRFWAIIFFGLIATSGIKARADDPVLQTQDFLNSSDRMNDVARENADAANAISQVKSLGLSAEGEKQLYQLSGDIFKGLSEQTGGDADALTLKVNSFLRNPASLEKEMSGDQLNRLHLLSNQLQDPQP